MGKKVLTIDDDPDARIYYKTILEELDLTVVEAGDGEAGLVKLATEKPDIVLLDLMMPKKGGLKVFNEIKENPAYQTLPIVIISGATKETGFDMKDYVYNRPFQARKEQVTGKHTETRPTEYLDKPVNPEDLLRVVKKALNIQ